MELDIPGILERCSEPGGAYLPLRRRGLDALVQRGVAVAGPRPDGNGKAARRLLGAYLQEP